MASEEKKETTTVQSVELEKIHVEYVGEEMVKLTRGIDTCVKKVHKFPQHLRGEE